MALEDKQHAEAVRSRIDMIVDAQEMRGGTSVPVRRRKPFNAKILIWILSAMGVVIVGLVVAILLVVKPWEYYEEGDSRIVRLCYYSSKTTSDLVKCVEENHGEDSIADGLHEIIEKKLSKIEEYGLDIIITYYQDIIDFTDDDTTVALLKYRLQEILQSDTNKQFGEQAVGDAVLIYSLEKNVSNAANVLNVASYYGNGEIMQEYAKIILEYEANEEDLETIG